MNDGRWTSRCGVCTGTGIAETADGYKPCDCPEGAWVAKHAPALLAVRRLRKDAIQRSVPQRPNIPPVDAEEDRQRKQAAQADLEQLLLRNRHAQS